MHYLAAAQRAFDNAPLAMSTPSVSDLQSQITALQSDKQTLTTQLAVANTAKADLTGKLTAETAKVTDLQGKLTAETAKVTELNGKVATLEGNAKTAEQRAQEIAASKGVPPGTKQSAETVPGNGTQTTDGAKHYADYQKAMDAGDGMKATEIWNAHKKAIETHVASLDAAASR